MNNISTHKTNKINMKTLTLAFMLLTVATFAQNRDSYIATGITEGLYEHFDTLGITRLVGTSDCEFSIETSTNLIFTLDHQYIKILKSETPDDYFLNEWPAYDIPDEHVAGEIKNLNRRKIQFTDVNIQVDISRIRVRYNPFRMKKQIKYQIKVTYMYNKNN